MSDTGWNVSPYVTTAIRRLMENATDGIVSSGAIAFLLRDMTTFTLFQAVESFVSHGFLTLNGASISSASWNETYTGVTITESGLAWMNGSSLQPWMNITY